MKTLIISSLLIVSFSATNFSHASETYLETDPLAWSLHGASINVKRSSTFHDNVTVGVGYFNLELSDSLINQNDKNKNKGWDVAVKNGYEFFIDYFFSHPDKGWFTGLQMSLYEFEIERNKSKSDYTSIITLWRTGYLWRPAGKGFYIMPWIGLGYSEKISGNNTVNGEEYDLDELVLFPTVYLGYSF